MTTGAARVETCQEAENECPAGYYCRSYSTYPVKCPPGYYCAAGTSEYTGTPCAAGTYGGLDSLSAAGECSACPAGHFCPVASVFPTQCGPGTYQPDSSQEADAACQPCPAGTVCPFYGLRHAATEIFCAHGHACPAGTKWRHEYPCPAGYFSDSISLTANDADQCTICPPKYACPQREDLPPMVDPVTPGETAYGPLAGPLGSNTLTNPKVACAPGHYCPEGTASASQYPCPSGTYSPVTDAFEEA
jgi:hypothetical protein